jgi:hypothetical protein
LSREFELNTCEATLEVDQKGLEELRTDVLGYKLTANFMENNLNFKTEELAD